MPNTYDAATLTDETNQVRLLISDTNTAAGKYIFEDAEIDALLELEGGVLLAAARALEVIAGNEILVQKRIKILDLSTDGPAEARELRAIAKEWREGAEKDAALSDTELGFDIAEIVHNDFTHRERLLKDMMRNA